MSEMGKKKMCVGDINIVDERVKQIMIDAEKDPIAGIESYIKKIRCDLLKYRDEEKRIWLFPWFRGECVTEEDSEYYKPLLPKLYRKRRENDPNFSENKLLQHFRMKAPVFSSDLVPKRDETDKWLFLAQHVGLPTRLLDWTESALVALYFALKEKRATHRFVWMLDPISLNMKSISTPTDTTEFSLIWHSPEQTNTCFFHNHNINIGNINIRGAWEEDKPSIELPVAILPTNIHPRMSVQRSCFTVHGWKKESIASLAPEHLICYMLSGNDEDIKQMSKDLEMLGVTHSTLFPDLDGLAMEMQDMDYYKRP
jgi:hypothetical protein